MTRKDYWNAKLYDNSHDFISKYGEAVVDLLAPQENEKILDIGCGTGDLAHILTEQGALVTGIDQSKNMIQQAKAKYPTISFSVANAASLTFDKQFDAVFSNATLHWIKTPKDVIYSVYKSLKPSGRFIAEFGGNGNVDKILNSILKQAKLQGHPVPDEHIPWYFPSIGEYTNLLENQGFHVTYAQLINRPTQLKGKDGMRKWITMFADEFFQGINIEDQNEIISAIETELKPKLFDGTDWIADYKRLRIACYK